MADDPLDDALDDQLRRWAAGDRPTVETLLADHPALSASDHLLDLIYHEAVLRE